MYITVFVHIPCFRKGQILLCKKNQSDSLKTFSETDIIKMLEFLIDNIFVLFVVFFSTESRYSYGY
jgi:hypothetical protein